MYFTDNLGIEHHVTLVPSVRVIRKLRSRVDFEYQGKTYSMNKYGIVASRKLSGGKPIYWYTDDLSDKQAFSLLREWYVTKDVGKHGMIYTFK